MSDAAFRWQIEAHRFMHRYSWRVYEVDRLTKRMEKGQTFTYLGARLAVWRAARKLRLQDRRSAFKREGTIKTKGDPA